MEMIAAAAETGREEQKNEKHVMMVPDESVRRSLTQPAINEEMSDVDLEENRSRKRSDDYATSSDRGELMSDAYFEEEEAIGQDMGLRKWEDFMEMQ